MYQILDNRNFWIYFIFTFIFVIIGVTYILMSDDNHKIIIAFIWMISNVILLCLIYHSSYILSPIERLSPCSTGRDITLLPDVYKNCCVIDTNSKCLEPKNRILFIINLLYIFLLILSTFWAFEVKNNSNTFLTCSGVILILGGLLLSSYSGDDIVNNPSVFSIGYLLIWICLSVYSSIK
jgi:hypothetical protein